MSSPDKAELPWFASPEELRVRYKELNIGNIPEHEELGRIRKLLIAHCVDPSSPKLVTDVNLPYQNTENAFLFVAMSAALEVVEKTQDVQEYWLMKGVDIFQWWTNYRDSKFFTPPAALAYCVRYGVGAIIVEVLPSSSTSDKLIERYAHCAGFKATTRQLANELPRLKRLLNARLIQTDQMDGPTDSAIAARRRAIATPSTECFNQVNVHMAYVSKSTAMLHYAWCKIASEKNDVQYLCEFWRRYGLDLEKDWQALRLNKASAEDVFAHLIENGVYYCHDKPNDYHEKLAVKEEKEESGSQPVYALVCTDEDAIVRFAWITKQWVYDHGKWARQKAYLERLLAARGVNVSYVRGGPKDDICKACDQILKAPTSAINNNRYVSYNEFDVIALRYLYLTAFPKDTDELEQLTATINRRYGTSLTDTITRYKEKTKRDDLGVLADALELGVALMDSVLPSTAGIKTLKDEMPSPNYSQLERYEQRLQKMSKAEAEAEAYSVMMAAFVAGNVAEEKGGPPAVVLAMEHVHAECCGEDLAAKTHINSLFNGLDLILKLSQVNAKDVNRALKSFLQAHPGSLTEVLEGVVIPAVNPGSIVIDGTDTTDTIRGNVRSAAMEMRRKSPEDVRRLHKAMIEAAHTIDFATWPSEKLDGKTIVEHLSYNPISVVHKDGVEIEDWRGAAADIIDEALFVVDSRASSPNPSRSRQRLLLSLMTQATNESLTEGCTTDLKATLLAVIEQTKRFQETLKLKGPTTMANGTEAIAGTLMTKSGRVRKLANTLKAASTESDNTAAGRQLAKMVRGPLAAFLAAKLGIKRQAVAKFLNTPEGLAAIKVVLAGLIAMTPLVEYDEFESEGVVEYSPSNRMAEVNHAMLEDGMADGKDFVVSLFTDPLFAGFAGAIERMQKLSTEKVRVDVGEKASTDAEAEVEAAQAPTTRARAHR